MKNRLVLGGFPCGRFVIIDDRFAVVSALDDSSREVLLGSTGASSLAGENVNFILTIYPDAMIAQN